MKTIYIKINKAFAICIVFCLVLILNSCTDFIAEVELDQDWKVLESGKMVVHYRPADFSSSASPDKLVIEKILDNQNFYYQAIQDSINRTFEDKVLIYLFNKDEANALIGTNNGGHAIPKFNTFYYTFLSVLAEYTDQYGIYKPQLGAHELVHIITHKTLGYPGTKLMSEGYAVWIDGGYAGYSIKEILKTYRDHQPVKILTPDELLFETVTNESVYYPNCGVFTGFLVKNYGPDIVNSLFTSTQSGFKNDFEFQSNESWEILCDRYSAFIDNL